MLGVLILLTALLCGGALWRVGRRHGIPGRTWPRRLVLVVPLVLLGLLSVPLDIWVVQAVRCGHQPIETSDFAAANSYTLPGDGTYTRYPILVSGYACDLDEVSGRQHDTLP